MTLSVPRVRHYLRECNLEKLFIEELGWDRHSARLSIEVDGQSYTLSAIAEKRGVQIFQCQPDAAGNIPDYAIRRKIDTQVSKLAYEHLIIFVDAGRTMQIWQWVARQPGQPAAYREHSYHPPHHAGDALIQKLEAILKNAKIVRAGKSDTVGMGSTVSVQKVKGEDKHVYTIVGAEEAEASDEAEGFAPILPIARGKCADVG